MSSLGKEYIADTYQGLLHNGGSNLSSVALERFFDGAGNSTSLYLSISGIGVGADNFEAGGIKYPTDTGGKGRGAVLTSTSSNQLGFKDQPEFFKDLLNLMYPVGAVFMSESERNPSERFIGTEWEQISKGKAVVGVGDGFNVGSNEASWTEGIKIPPHYHGVGRFKGRDKPRSGVTYLAVIYKSSNPRQSHNLADFLNRFTKRIGGYRTFNRGKIYHYWPTNVDANAINYPRESNSQLWKYSPPAQDPPSAGVERNYLPIDEGDTANDDIIFIIAKKQELPEKGWVSLNGDYIARRKGGNRGVRGIDWEMVDGGGREQAVITTTQYNFNDEGEDASITIDTTPPAHGLYVWRRLK